MYMYVKKNKKNVDEGCNWTVKENIRLSLNEDRISFTECVSEKIIIKNTLNFLCIEAQHSTA